jgi:hypothetical protein
MAVRVTGFEVRSSARCEIRPQDVLGFSVYLNREGVYKGNLIARAQMIVKFFFFSVLDRDSMMLVVCNSDYDEC